MASISEQRLKEMEAEMNRFEQEIAPVDGQGGQMSMIIGSNTFNTVQAQLRQIRNETSGKPALVAPPPPPPPPPPETTSSSEQQQQQQPPPLLPPPPPPPPLLNRPAFVPPQLRHRPLPPRPPMHPMGPGPQHHSFQGPSGPGPMGAMGPGPFSPPNMMGPPGPPMGMGPMGHPGMPQQGPMGFPPQGPFQQPGFPMMGGEQMMGEGMTEAPNSSNPAVIEAKPKVIYSAPPVRTVPKKPKKGKSGGKEKAEENAAGAGTSLADSASSGAVAAGDGEAFAAVPVGQDDPAPVDMELDTEVSAPTKKEKKEKKKKFVRTAAGTVWEDPTLAEWDTDDFRMFCGDLGNEVTDETLQRAFGKYPSFVKAKVVRDRRSNKTKGYGFASFKDPVDFTRAMREMNGKYVGNRPIKLRKSTWKDRSIEIVRKKEKEKKRLGLR